MQHVHGGQVTGVRCLMIQTRKSRQQEKHIQRARMSHLHMQHVHGGQVTGVRCTTELLNVGDLLLRICVDCRNY